MSSTSSFPLMFVYTVVALLLQALFIGVIVLIEEYLLGWSGAVFMISYLFAFWIAWIIAVRLTEPKNSQAETQTSRA